MYVIFLFPLLFSIVATIQFVTGEYGPITKGFFGLLTALAATLQFMPSLQEQVHFLVPLFMQLFVCGCWYFASQFE
ncbi:MAG: hypothetical protein R3C12_06650 [Planctomycetaceae bacterium]|nr:hypothetical protein [Planctomycetaceae bacterium]